MLFKTGTLVFVAAIMCVCNNPFFPPAGEPMKSPPLRSTPEGVVQQLVKAYDKKRITLFTDLLSADFKFYVPLEFAQNLDWSGKSDVSNKVVIDTTVPFMSQGDVYYFWRRDLEVEIHQKMFDPSYTISFPNGLSIDSIQVITSNDSAHDTTGFAIRTTATTLEILSPQTEQVFGLESNSLPIKSQVFFLVRDPADPKLWLINEWFELTF